jgi:hypothetical protein
MLEITGGILLAGVAVLAFGVLCALVIVLKEAFLD